jgi:uncharacterized metal-binding protein
MPSGAAHDRITWVTAALAVPAWWELAPSHDPAPLALTLGAYLFSGLLLSDDLDTKSVCYRRWGPLRLLWLPYQKLVPHRSWLSHGLGIGPLLRVVYFAAAAGMAATGLLWLLAREGVPVRQYNLTDRFLTHGAAWTLMHPTVSVWLLLGLVLGGVTHSIADMMVSGAKRLW